MLESRLKKGGRPDELRHFSEVAHIPIIAMSVFLEDGYVVLLNICGIKNALRNHFIRWM